MAIAFRQSMGVDLGGLRVIQVSLVLKLGEKFKVQLKYGHGTSFWTKKTMTPQVMTPVLMIELERILTFVNAKLIARRDY
jgi:hypothetical protein